MVASLFAQHRDIMGLCERLLGLAQFRTPPTEQEFSRLRWEVWHALNRHMAEEDRLANAPLKSIRDPRVQEAVRRYERGHGLLRTCLAEFNNRWPTAAALADLPGFAADFQAQLRTLKDYMRWEETEFYPLAARHGVAGRAGPALPAALQSI